MKKELKKLLEEKAQKDKRVKAFLQRYYFLLKRRGIGDNNIDEKIIMEVEKSPIPNSCRIHLLENIGINIIKVEKSEIISYVIGNEEQRTFSFSKLIVKENDKYNVIDPYKYNVA